MKKNNFIKIYNGYGHTHNMHVYGHVFEKPPFVQQKFTHNVFRNLFSLLRLFFVKPLPGISLELNEEGQIVKGKTGSDGFFAFEWESSIHLTAGWHSVKVSTVSTEEKKITGTGKVFIPHITQFAFISDIDDTIMVSHSSTIIKRLKVLFTKNSRTRNIFNNVASHYSQLAAAHTTPDTPNPFFYVSSSEWNLYDYLADFFSYNKLPEGIFLLSQAKRWYQLLKTGKTKHGGKLLRMKRVLDTFPHQQFVLFGDNSQSDPEIYTTLAEHLPGRIFAVYIRNVNADKEMQAKKLLEKIETDSGKKIHTCFFKQSTEAIAHSKMIGLID